MKNIILIIVSLYSFTLLAQNETWLLPLEEKISFTYDGNNYSSSIVVVDPKGILSLVTEDKNSEPKLIKVNDLNRETRIKANRVYTNYVLGKISFFKIADVKGQNLDSSSFFTKSGQIKPMSIKANTDGLLYLLKRFW